HASQSPFVVGQERMPLPPRMMSMPRPELWITRRVISIVRRPWHAEGVLTDYQRRPTMSIPLQTNTTIPDHILEAATADLEYRDLHEWIPWAWAILTRNGDAPSRIDE